jgi:uncharacterized protein
VPTSFITAKLKGQTANLINNDWQCTDMPVKNVTKRKLLASKECVCDTFFSRAKGLMFHNKIRDEAFVLAFPYEQHVALHMFFVFFPIDVIFLDKNQKVVELKRDFRPFSQYSMEKRAKYIVELPAGRIAATKTNIGDKIQI